MRTEHIVILILLIVIIYFVMKRQENLSLSGDKCTYDDQCQSKKCNKFKCV
jgi:hypothetical protein